MKTVRFTVEATVPDDTCEEELGDVADAIHDALLDSRRTALRHVSFDRVSETL